MTQIWVCISCVTRHSTYISYPICQLIFFPCSFLYGDTSTPGNKHNCANLKLYASQQLYCVSLSIQDSYGRLFAKTKDIFRKFKGWRWRVKQWLTEEREKKRKQVSEQDREKVQKGKEGRQIDHIAVAWQLNQYNLSTLVSSLCCDSPVLEVGSVLYSSYSAPPRPLKRPADWCGKRCPRSHPRWQRWKVGHCGKHPDRWQWVGEHLCLLVDFPVGYKRVCAVRGGGSPNALQLGDVELLMFV